MSRTPKADDSLKARRHRGDIMSPETRSAVMSKIRGKDTGPERALGSALLDLGFCWESHATDLPGRPDFAFREEEVAVFVDGDFWHGFRFQLWRDKLSESWEAKIAENRKRDRRNSVLLLGAGWTVVRVWEHEIERSPIRASQRVARAIAAARLEKMQPGHGAPNLVANEVERGSQAGST